MPAPEAPSEETVRGYLKTLSNWGRWGSEDELGTVNLITPAKRQAGPVRTSRDGRWESLLTVAPLRLKGVTGAPVNPIAVF